ncbi:WD40 repeat domain-containing serine/threonine protein kinase [Nonomuraea fuscirosea]|uniref:WD40 repeat domain-containing serine/threonine protein kinase n=1 Tax=Nonomuraea fuscirosea TaxID=1291556 RepID=UPI00342BF4EE
MTALTPSDPRRLGRYWLAGRLGAGGQGVVYEAYGESGERVAVKVPRLDGPEARARLAKEAAAAGRVASFCTAAVIEAQVEQAPLYIVSEYVPGPSLRRAVTESGPYGADALRRLAIGVATALTAIHQAGIVHRDLKPDNIILGPDGPRVIDFGVARETGPTTTGPIMGTPGYMAPEVLTGRAATGAADVWAWAMVLLFAARGSDAIPAGEPMAVVSRVLEFTADVASLPDEIAPLVSAATTHDPATRPAASDLLLGLLDLLDVPGLPGSSGRPGLPGLPGDGGDLVGDGGGRAGVGGGPAGDGRWVGDGGGRAGDGRWAFEGGGPAGGGDRSGGEPADDPLVRGSGVAAELTGEADPGLGAVAEELYRELSEAERACVPEVFLRMLDGDTLRPVRRDVLPEIEGLDAMLDLFAAAGLVTRREETPESDWTPEPSGEASKPLGEADERTGEAGERTGEAGERTGEEGERGGEAGEPSGELDERTREAGERGEETDERGGVVYELPAPGLVRAWPRLREWVAANRDGLPVHRRLADAAAEWDGHGRRPADLMQGTPLDRTLRWAAAERRDLTLARREREFLDAAAAEVRRRGRRRGLIAAALAVLLVVALGGLGTAEYLRRESVRQRDDARAKELALRASGLREVEPELARLLSVAAWRLSPETTEARGALLDSASQHVSDVFTAPYVDSSSVQALDVDGRILAAATDGTARLWDVTSGRRLREVTGIGTGVTRLAVSRDGRRLAALDDDGVRVWDTLTGRPLGGPFAKEAGGFGGLEFDRSGRLISVPRPSGGAEWWDVSKRARLTAPGGAALIGVSPDGRYGVVAAGQRTAEVWDLRRGRRLRLPSLPGTGTTTAAAFSDDSRALALVEDTPRHDKPITHLYDLTTRTAKQPVEGSTLQAADFVFGGGYIALWSPGEQLTVARWDDWTTMLTLPLPADPVQVRYDLVGRAVRVLNGQGGVVTLDVSMMFDRPLRLDPPLDHDVVTLKVAPGGRMLAVKREPSALTAHQLRTLELLDPATGARKAGPIAWKGEGKAMAFSRDGTRLAFGDGEVVRVLDVASGRVTQQFGLVAEQDDSSSGPAYSVSEQIEGTFEPSESAPEPSDSVSESADSASEPSESAAESAESASERPGSVSELAFGPDGRTLAVQPDGGEFFVVDLRDLKRRSFAGGGVPGGGPMEFAPDGARLFVAEPQPRLYDPGREALVPVAAGTGSLEGAFAYSPDGRRIAFSGPDRITVWDRDLRTRLGAFPVTAGMREAIMLTWSPDGRWIASFEDGPRLRLWDVASGRQIGVVYDGLAESDIDNAWLGFSADGTKLHSLGVDGTFRTHELDGARLAATVCELAGRALTAAEWRDYMPGVDPFDLCT